MSRLFALPDLIDFLAQQSAQARAGAQASQQQATNIFAEGIARALAGQSAAGRALIEANARQVPESARIADAFRGKFNVGIDRRPDPAAQERAQREADRKAEKEAAKQEEKDKARKDRLAAQTAAVWSNAAAQLANPDADPDGVAADARKQLAAIKSQWDAVSPDEPFYEMGDQAVTIAALREGGAPEPGQFLSRVIDPKTGALISDVDTDAPIAASSAPQVEAGATDGLAESFRRMRPKHGILGELGPVTRERLAMAEQDSLARMALPGLTEFFAGPPHNRQRPAGPQFTGASSPPADAAGTAIGSAHPGLAPLLRNAMGPQDFANAEADVGSGIPPISLPFAGPGSDFSSMRFEPPTTGRSARRRPAPQGVPSAVGAIPGIGGGPRALADILTLHALAQMGY